MRFDRQRAVPIALSCGLILVASAISSLVTNAADNSTAASLQIHVIGAREVRLADPLGRVYPRTDSAQVAMPDCQSWENVLLRPVSARAAVIPRAQLAIARPLEGTYRIELAGTGKQVFLEFVAWGGDSTAGMQDHLVVAADTIYRWDASWKRAPSGAKFVVGLKRAARRAKTTVVR